MPAFLGIFFSLDDVMILTETIIRSDWLVIPQQMQSPEIFLIESGCIF